MTTTSSAPQNAATKNAPAKGVGKPRASGDIYPKNSSPKLDMELFRNPTSEYRGTPFWSWNTKLDTAQLFRQIEHFRQMGFGGFHIHARTGLATPYMGEEFLSIVKACADKAAQTQMLCWLYDEDRWPSGFAGGLVTKDQKYRVKHLLWTLTPYSGVIDAACQDEAARGTRSENGVLLARYEVVLKNKRLGSYRRLKENETPAPDARVWHAYLESAQGSSWFNHQTYVDTFSVDAIKRFLEVTHEQYFKTVGEYFGTVVPAIFTDEPQFPKKTTFLTAYATKDVIMPFTTDFAQTFQQVYGDDLLDYLPEIFWDLPDGKVSVARYRYNDHTAERFAVAYSDTIGQWCEKHHIALTGHMLGEPNLFSQTRALGEAMRPLRSFQLPGIDMLCDRMELTTAKQAQSVCHQYGRAGVTSELYGVTNWDYDFVGHKAQGDWQAALGVTVRVPHLAWVSMAGESKRDYPAAIGYQSPWYTEYRLIEDHFSRLNTVLTRGKPAVRIGVIHPVESYWLCWGPVEQNQSEMDLREETFRDVTSWLAFGLIDYDFISEGLLPAQANQPQGKQLAVGQMRYDAVVLPSMRTVRSTTLKLLEKFAEAGGTVIFASEIPSLLDAVPSDLPAKFAAKCRQCQFSRKPLLQAIEEFRELDIRHEDGSQADTLLHQIRSDGNQRHIFLVNTDREKPRVNASIRTPGAWTAEMLDTMTGQTAAIPTRIEEGYTMIPFSIAAHGHLLATLSPAPAGNTDTRPMAAPAEPKWTEIGRLADPVKISLSEPNVLLLDQAQWRLDSGEWEPLEEILRLDNQARAKLGQAMRAGRIAQPWTDPTDAPVLAQLQLRFALRYDVAVKAPSLALENAEQTHIQIDGKAVESRITGYWVDESIKTVQLPDLADGNHELILTIPFTRKTDVEWCYLLGDFGVAVAGRYAHITAPVRSLAFGDWSHQGLPFYGGNVTYHCTIDGTGKETILEAPKFKNPLLRVELDGRPLGPIAFAPFQISLGKLTGKHQVDITAYGNRMNAFGSIHNANEKLTWYGPGAYRHSGPAWAYEYQLRRMGVLMAPLIKTAE